MFNCNKKQLVEFVQSRIIITDYPLTSFELNILSKEALFGIVNNNERSLNEFREYVTLD